MIEFSRTAGNCMRNSATKFRPSDNFWHIYTDLAYIYEGYARSYERILMSEGLADALLDIGSMTNEAKANIRAKKRRVERATIDSPIRN